MTIVWLSCVARNGNRDSAADEGPACDGVVCCYRSDESEASNSSDCCDGQYLFACYGHCSSLYVVQLGGVESGVRHFADVRNHRNVELTGLEAYGLNDDAEVTVCSLIALTHAGSPCTSDCFWHPGIITSSLVCECACYDSDYYVFRTAAPPTTLRFL